jgi:hypothetical protein
MMVEADREETGGAQKQKQKKGREEKKQAIPPIPHFLIPTAPHRIGGEEE